jgi:[protein-PII] uridylyltransferase
LVNMVRYHLLLPDTATRRDLADSATVAMVAEAVGGAQLLELLDCLTRADAAATGPAAWSTWKAGLVAELVELTRSELSGRSTPSAPLLTPSQQALASGSGVQVLLESVDDNLWLTVAVDDRVGVLGVIAGVLACNRLTVRSARTDTFGPRAVTIWSVQTEFGDPPGEERLREDIRQALAGNLNIAGILKSRGDAYQRASRVPVPPPQFRVAVDASDRATVVEVRAHDAPGLLHTIAQAISTTGVSIEGAKVATLGSEVVDVFYLSAQGELLTDEQVRSVRDAVLAALQPADG